MSLPSIVGSHAVEESRIFRPRGLRDGADDRFRLPAKGVRDGEDPCRLRRHGAVEARTPAAATLSNAFGARFGVVSVVPRRPGRFPIDPWDDGKVHANELIEARDLLWADGLEAELFEPVGDPAVMIEQVAENGGYDKVVVGARGLGAIGRMLQGSVSEQVATHASTTVVVAR